MTATDIPLGEPRHRRARRELPPPMVRFGRHPFRWSSQRLKRLGLALVLAHIGTLIIVALYYLIFQVHYHVAGRTYTLKHWWDTTVSDTNLRHSIRNVAEGVLGGWLAKAVVWNHYKHRRRGPIERLEERLHVPRVLIAPVMAAIYFAAAFTALYWGDTQFNSSFSNGVTVTVA